MLRRGERMCSLTKNSTTVRDAEMIIFAIMVLYVTSTATADINGSCATCIKVNTTCYNLTYVVELKAPFRSTVVIRKVMLLRATNALYYSFEPYITDSEYYKIAYVNLDNMNVTGILSERNKVFNFGAFDIDQNNEIIYLGGSIGIYAWNTKDDSLTHYSSYGETILSIFYKGYVYFVKYGENKIIQKKGGEFVSHLEFEPIKDFVITKNYIVVFLSSYGLFASKNGEIVRLSKNAFFRGLTIDLDGSVYAWWLDGIHKVILNEDNIKESVIVKVANIPEIGAMTFDNQNNILFTSDKYLYKLTSTRFTKC